MSSRGRARGRSTPVELRRGGTAGNGKTTDSDNLMATAKLGQTAATKSTAAEPRRGGPRRAPTLSPKQSAATGVSAPDMIRRRRAESAVPSGLVRSQATIRKSAARNRFREESSPASAHSRSTSRKRTRRPDSSWFEHGEPTDAPRSRESVEAVVDCLKTQVRQLLDAVRDRGEVLTRKVQEWMDTLVEAVAHGGAGMQAGLEGIRAAATGKNPVLAAIKGLVSGLSGQAKVALVLLLVFGLLLGPVVLVVLLLVLVVAALVAAVRAAAE
jgi:hypothetical protein